MINYILREGEQKRTSASRRQLENRLNKLEGGV
jgi:hypothetical protein